MVKTEILSPPRLREDQRIACVGSLPLQDAAPCLSLQSRRRKPPAFAPVEHHEVEQTPIREFQLIQVYWDIGRS